MDRFTDSIARFRALVSTGSGTTVPPSDGSSGKYSIPEDYDDPLWRLGWSDGRLGQPPNEHDAILKSLASQHWNEEVARAEVDLNTKVAERALWVDQRNRAENLAEAADGRLAAIVQERADSRGEFSLPVGVFYVGLGVLLFAADIPLSLKFVSDAFGIELQKSPVEAFLVALGVAGTGFFFKIAVDYLLQTEKRYSVRRSWWRFGLAALVMSSIFVCTGATLWYVGKVRAVAKQNQSVLKNARSQQGRVGRAGAKGSTVNPATAAPQSERDAIIDTGFKLMAFTFPLVGAVCVAVGLRRIHNGTELRQRTREVDRAREIFATAALRAHQAVADVSALEQSRGRLQERRNEKYDLWRGIYLHGYFRGTCVPQSLNDGAPIHEIVEQMVQRWLALAAREQNKRLSAGATK